MERSATSFAWLAAGGILLFAVNGHPSFINLQLVGLILITRSAVGLGLGIGRAGLARSANAVATAVAGGIQTLDTLTTDPAGDRSTRVPLTDLLGRPAGRVNEDRLGSADR